MRQFVFKSVEKVSQAEFAEWCPLQDDPRQYELLNGRIIVNPPAGWPHGESEVNVAAALAVFVKAKRLGRVFGPSQGFELPSGDTVGPDAAFVSRDRWTAMHPPEFGKFLRVVPDLIVEVLSRKTRKKDRIKKKAIYEKNGVQEYWLVDDKDRNVVVFSLVDGNYDEGRKSERDQNVVSTVLTGFSVPVADLMAQE